MLKTDQSMILLHKSLKYSIRKLLDTEEKYYNSPVSIKHVFNHCKWILFTCLCSRAQCVPQLPYPPDAIYEQPPSRKGFCNEGQ